MKAKFWTSYTMILIYNPILRYIFKREWSFIFISITVTKENQDTYEK